MRKSKSERLNKVQPGLTAQSMFICLQSISLLHILFNLQEFPKSWFGLTAHIQRQGAGVLGWLPMRIEGGGLCGFVKCERSFTNRHGFQTWVFCLDPVSKHVNNIVKKGIQHQQGVGLKYGHEIEKKAIVSGCAYSVITFCWLQPAASPLPQRPKRQKCFHIKAKQNHKQTKYWKEETGDGCEQRENARGALRMRWGEVLISHWQTQ